MKSGRLFARFFSGMFLSMLLLFARQAFAAESTQDWRDTYDLILMWVNFGIFAFVIIKFGKDPIKKFLKGQRQEIEETIKRLESEKEASEKDISDLKTAVQESKIRFGDIKQKLLAQGEFRKTEIVADAKLQSRLMMEDARRKIDHHLRTARKTLMDEMIDAAMETVLKKLPGELTSDDSNLFLQRYFDKIVDTQASQKDL